MDRIPELVANIINKIQMPQAIEEAQTNKLAESIKAESTLIILRYTLNKVKYLSIPTKTTTTELMDLT